MSRHPRLTVDLLGRLGGVVQRPGYDPRTLRTGVVHLGIGAFHRAHQAALTDAAEDVADGGWGTVAATQRSRDVLDRLHPQDGLFTVVTRDGATEGPAARVVGTVRDVLHARTDADALRRALAAPRTRIVSTTVTEKGYAADLATRTLRHTDPDVQADLADPRPHRSVIGQLVAGMAARADADLDGFTVLCCDNVERGGELLKTLCEQFLERWSAPAAADTAAWCTTRASFPNTLVDRIVPATTNSDLRHYADQLGYRDDALVTAEPYGLWVIEDAFAASRPAWPGNEVRLVERVGPWSDLKLRLLNGAHSLLAMLGLLDGRATVREAITVPWIAAAVDRWFDEAGRSLHEWPDGVDPASYRATLLRRFQNPGIDHRLEQVAADTSLKLRARAVPVAAGNTAADHPADVSALAVAAWLSWVARSTHEGHGITDPAANELTAALPPGFDARRAVETLLGDGGPLPLPTRLHGTFTNRVAELLDLIRRAGPRAAAEAVTTPAEPENGD